VSGLVIAAGGVTTAMQSFSAQFSGLGSAGMTRGNVLVVALLVLGVLALAALATLVLLPAQRKVVRKRRVRRVRRAVAVPQSTASEPSEDDGSDADSSGLPTRLASPGRAGLLTAIIWVIVCVLVFVGTYMATGTNRYCGQSCHVSDRHVALAVKHPHGTCVGCHESGPVTGLVSRFRMAYVYQFEQMKVVSVPIDPARCIRCHRDVRRNVVRTSAGITVSHAAILAGGRTCSDCHAEIGHRKGRSFVGGMSSCMACHDGKKAPRACTTCHSKGSPIASVSPKREDSTFDYPAVRVANRDCTRCHGSEKKCIACHNGFVLPHPTEFRRGGHARAAGFSGKERCFKCHSIAWCGSGRCHNAFSAHDEKAWVKGHQAGTSAQCASCHLSWSGNGDFCKLCH